MLFNLRLLCTLVLFSKTLVSDGNTMRQGVKPIHGDSVAQDKLGISWREFRSLLTGKERIQRQRSDTKTGGQTAPTATS